MTRSAAYLESRHDAALSGARGGRKVYTYKYALNGFVADVRIRQPVAGLHTTEGWPATVTAAHHVAIGADGRLTLSLTLSVSSI